MKEEYYFNQLLKSGEFRFSDLVLDGIDNEPILRINDPQMAEQETCLFHRDINTGDAYFTILHKYVSDSVGSKRPGPVVRFADGEYSFYANRLHCNGLYQQAASKAAIKKAVPFHVAALRELTQKGLLAPLIFPGNTQKESRKSFLSLLHRTRIDNSAIFFLQFLHENSISLTKDNYLPFYVVYAYLVSSQFSRLVDGKKLSIISSECNTNSCLKWFAHFSSEPEIIFTEIPDRYVATEWKSIGKRILDLIPSDIEICLVGAGIGALPICIDVAERFSVPAIDAGHILNMMNNREDKSNGPRLYAMRQ